MFQNLAITVLVVILIFIAANFGKTSPAASKMTAGIHRLNAAMATR